MGVAAQTQLASTSLPPLLKAENPRGTVVILNGCPSQVAHTLLTKHLSTGLIDKGWNTLLLDLPASETHNNSALIEQGIQYANAQSGTPIALLGHDCDATEILNLSKKSPANIAAYITLSLSNSAIPQEDYNFNAPLLDIHGSAQANSLTNTAWVKSIEKSGGRRMELPMADDNFSEQESGLIFLISNWLKNQ